MKSLARNKHVNINSIGLLPVFNHKTFKIIYNNCKNYFDWLIFVTKELLYPREAVSLLSSIWKGYICLPYGYGHNQTLLCTARMFLTQRNVAACLLWAICACSCDFVQHPLIYKRFNYIGL